jgi:glycosyltransferase involved in cell wall biosynthesis
MKKLAFLVNQYPAPSHTFIRREIAALENLGWQVHRFSHRRSRAALVDPLDVAEAGRTHVLLDQGFTRLFIDVFCTLLARPRRLLVELCRAGLTEFYGRGGVIRGVGYLVLACSLGRRMREVGLTHVHAHFGTNPAAVAMLCRRIFGVTYSLTLHGPEEFSDPLRLRLVEKIGGAEFVVAICDAGRRELSRVAPNAVEKIKLVRCGLDESWFELCPSPIDASSTLVCVARLDEQKHPLLLVEAAKILARRGAQFELILIGDGPLRDAVVSELDVEADADKNRRTGMSFDSRQEYPLHFELSEGATVRLAGWQSQEQIIAHLRPCRALVLSSRAEGLPVAIMEAFALARSVIATDVGGVSELVQNGMTGWLVMPNDATALADAMFACLAASPEQLNQMGNAGRELLRKNHEIIQSATTLDGLFRQYNVTRDPGA